MKKASKKTPTKPSVKALNKNIKEILPKKSLFKKNFTYPVIAVLVIVAAMNAGMPAIMRFSSRIKSILNVFIIFII